MVTPHNVVVRENLGNSPMYQWEANCSCGWSAKVPTEGEAKEVAQRHINANGAKGTFKVQPTSVTFDPSKGTEAKPAVPVSTAKFAPSVTKPLTPASSSGTGGLPPKKF